MQMLIDNNWLRRAIATDLDLECEAGGAVALLDTLGMFLPSDISPDLSEKVVEMKYAFGVFVKMLRKQSSLTVAELSTKARVAEEELRLIERDPHHKAGPRTVHHLALYFKIEPTRLMKLSGATVIANENVRETAVRFAAKSDDLSGLTSEERRMLNDFVKYVNESQDLAN